MNDESVWHFGSHKHCTEQTHRVFHLMPFLFFILYSFLFSSVCDVRYDSTMILLFFKQNQYVKNHHLNVNAIMVEYNINSGSVTIFPSIHAIPTTVWNYHGQIHSKLLCIFYKNEYSHQLHANTHYIHTYIKCTTNKNNFIEWFVRCTLFCSINSMIALNSSEYASWSTWGWWWRESPMA